MSVLKFSLANHLAPSRIPPKAKAAPFTQLHILRNLSLYIHFGHPTRWPAVSALDFYVTPLKKAKRAIEDFAAWCPRKGLEHWPLNPGRIPIQRPDQELHMPISQVDVFLHLPLLFVAQFGQPIRTIP